MAHIRTAHPVMLYIAGKSQPETGLDRLVVLTWKGNKTTGREAHSARCLSVPVWTPRLDGDDKHFSDLLVDAVETRQKAKAHAYVTNMLETNGGVCNDIPADVLSPETILADFFAEESDSDSSRGKLSGAQIGAWFKEVLQPLMEAHLADKSGWLADGYQMSEEQAKKLSQAANGYRACMERLASPTPKVDVPTAKQLLKAVELLGGDSDRDMVARKLARKIEVIINPPVEKVVTLEML